MRTIRTTQFDQGGGFTLIELLVVIAIIVAFINRDDGS